MENVKNAVVLQLWSTTIECSSEKEGATVWALSNLGRKSIPLVFNCKSSKLQQVNSIQVKAQQPWLAILEIEAMGEEIKALGETSDCSEKTYTGIKLVNARYERSGRSYGHAIYANMNCKKGLLASNAINGLVCKDKCGAHSARPYDKSLLVDLKSPTKVNYIVIYGRQDTNWGYHGSGYTRMVITVDERTSCKARENYDGSWRKKFGLETPMFYDCDKTVENAKTIKIPTTINEVQVGYLHRVKRWGHALASAGKTI